MTRTPGLERWWPTTQALDLVKASVEDVAGALRREIERSVSGEPIEESWTAFASIDEALTSVERYTNVPTAVLAFATESPWTILWSNGFHCTGFDSVASGLTRTHGFETLHFCVHDEATTTPPGGGFTWRARKGAEVVERSVHSWCTGGYWAIVEAGPPLAEEDLGGYLSPEMSERLDERTMKEFLARKGIEPWNEAFYRLAPDRTFRLERTSPPETVEVRAPERVVAGLEARVPVADPQR